MESTLKVPLSFMAFSKIIPVNVYKQKYRKYTTNVQMYS